MPIEKSNWSENDLNYLNLGGNSRLKEFMSIYNFPLNETGDNKTNLENKYLRKGILEYIKDLVNKLEGKQIKEININKESALKKINLVELNETVFSLCLKNEHFLKEKIYIDTCNYNIKDGGSLFKDEKQ